MIKILWKVGLPGSGKTLSSHRTEELLMKHGYNTYFMDDKLPLDIAVWNDVSRFLDDPARRTEHGAVIGEHSMVHNPDDGVGRLSIDFFDGDGLNSGHREYFSRLVEQVKNLGPRDIIVAELTPGIDDSFGPGKVPVIHNPTWMRKQIIENRLLPISLIEEIIADDPVRLLRNNERKSYNIPEELFKREFSNRGGLFTWADKISFGTRYYQMKNNGDDDRVFLQDVDRRFELLFAPRLGIEGQSRRLEQRL